MLFLRKPGPVAVGRIVDGEGCPRSPRKPMEAFRVPSRSPLELGSRLGRTCSSGMRVCSGAQTSREQVPQGRLLSRSRSCGAQTAREVKKWKSASGSFLRDGSAKINNRVDLPWCALEVPTPVGNVKNDTEIREKDIPRGATGGEKKETGAVLDEDKGADTPTVSKLYNLNEEIGRGTYGVVYSGSEVASGRRVAVKKIPSKKGMRSGGVGLHNKAKQEADIMKALQDCTSAVQFRGFYDREDDKKDDAAYIVMEHCSGGDLNSFVQVSLKNVVCAL